MGIAWNGASIDVRVKISHAPADETLRQLFARQKHSSHEKGRWKNNGPL
jgi:hypothetical protein